ncbi:MAG: DUF4150 domain-containing protein [Desulfovibrionaceae bacterium]
MFACCKENGMALAFPDVCKTPMPAPVPVPYPNMGQMMMAAPGAEKVLISGMPAVNKSCEIMPTEGDTAGVEMGVESSTIMGPGKFTAGSMKVRIQGSAAQRMGDATTQNKQNAVGTVIEPSQEKVMINS